MINRRIAKTNVASDGYRSCAYNAKTPCGNMTAPTTPNVSNDCKALMKKLQSIDFSIIDTVLYLDAYPERKKAMAYYNKLLLERAALRKTLAEKCRRPMSSFENGSDNWDWISSPWPWDVSAN